MIATAVPRTVVLVDDDDGVRFGLRAALTARGYQVEEASRCQAALVLAAHCPDVVLLDYQLPDGNGIDLMRQLRARGVTAPIVILTGYATIPLAVQAMREGAHDVLSKPVAVPELLKLVARLLESDAPAPVSGQTPIGSLWELERQALVNALVEEGGRVGRAALRLSIPRSTIYWKIKAHDIDVDAIRDAAVKHRIAGRGRDKG